MKQAETRHLLFANTYKRISPLVKNKKHIPYFTITFSLFTLSFFGVFAIHPTIITALSLINSVSRLKELNIHYEKKISSFIQAQTQYELIRSELPEILTSIPHSSSFHTLVRRLEQFADESNLSISQMQVDTVPISHLSTSPELYTYGFSILASGEYSSILSYIKKLTNWQRIVNLDSLELSQEGSTISGHLRAKIRGITYYEP